MVAKKASRSAAALARLMPNVRGPGQWKRKFLSTVVESQLLYAAPVWATRVSEIARTKANLIRPQRSAALRVKRAYWTISDGAALWFLLACHHRTYYVLKDSKPGTGETPHPTPENTSHPKQPTSGRRESPPSPSGRQGGTRRKRGMDAPSDP